MGCGSSVIPPVADERSSTMNSKGTQTDISQTPQGDNVPAQPSDASGPAKTSPASNVRANNGGTTMRHSSSDVGTGYSPTADQPSTTSPPSARHLPSTGLPDPQRASGSTALRPGHTSDFDGEDEAADAFDNTAVAPPVITASQMQVRASLIQLGSRRESRVGSFRRSSKFMLFDSLAVASSVPIIHELIDIHGDDRFEYDASDAQAHFALLYFDFQVERCSDIVARRAARGTRAPSASSGVVSHFSSLSLPVSSAATPLMGPMSLPTPSYAPRSSAIAAGRGSATSGTGLGFFNTPGYSYGGGAGGGHGAGTGSASANASGLHSMHGPASSSSGSVPAAGLASGAASVSVGSGSLVGAADGSQRSSGPLPALSAAPSEDPLFAGGAYTGTYAASSAASQV